MTALGCHDAQDVVRPARRGVLAAQVDRGIPAGQGEDGRDQERDRDEDRREGRARRGQRVRLVRARRVRPELVVRGDRLAGHPGQGVERHRGQDREPGPGHERRAQVVAADVRVDVRGREEAGDGRRRPGQQRVARPARRRRDEPDRDERGEDPELARGEVDEVAELARQLTERVLEAALELLGEDDVLEALPGVRRAVDEGGLERARGRPDRQLEVDGDEGEHQDADARPDQPAAAPDPRIDRQDVEPDRDREQERQRVVADRQPEDERRGDEEAVAPIGGLGRAGVRVPRDQQPEQDRDEREVERVRLGVGPDRPGDRGQGHGDPGRDPEDEPAGQRPDEIDGDPGGDRQADRREEVHPERGLAERLEDDRREPAEQDVGREARRMGGAEERRHRLELARVPELDPGQQRRPGRSERDEGGQQRRQEPRARVGHPITIRVIWRTACRIGVRRAGRGRRGRARRSLRRPCATLRPTFPRSCRSRSR